MNPEEVFSCRDLIEGKLLLDNLLDYRICRKEKRLQTAKIGKKQSCTDYRAIGKRIF